MLWTTLQAPRVATVLVLIACMLGICQAADDQGPSNIDDVQDRIEKTNRLLDELSAEIKRSDALKKDLQNALALTKSKLNEREQRVRQLQEQIDNYDQRLERVAQKIENARSEFHNSRSELSESLRAAHQLGSQTPLKMLLQGENHVQAQRLQVYGNYVFRAQKKQIRSQIDFLNQLNTAQNQLKKDRNWLHHIQKKANQQRQGYSQTVEQSRSELTEIHRTIEQKANSLSELRDDQKRLESLMEELTSPEAAQSGYFLSQKGSYTLPVEEGTIGARFGEQKNVGKLSWNGLFIQASSGTAVKAMADGEVLYSDWLQGFGMLVILEHGDGYMSLYGGNSTVLAQTGEWVESGSTIATVGDSGGQNSSGLYFEIRHNATALNPEDWVSFDRS
ncbi:MAG: peptidoglycan DD-metalloendopeptidase family protein [Granulosicoccus sp.]|nr:peptidoglycan DD-metalloendopeptidase family protein [Granulosicoccus sp.]